MSMRWAYMGSGVWLLGLSCILSSVDRAGAVLADRHRLCLHGGCLCMGLIGLLGSVLAAHGMHFCPATGNWMWCCGAAWQAALGTNPALVPWCCRSISLGLHWLRANLCQRHSHTGLWALVYRSLHISDVVPSHLLVRISP